MRLSVIIVNYRTPQLVLDCLHSLQTEIDAEQEVVVVVDNASEDGSLEKIAAAITANRWQQWVKLLASSVNGGFSAGNNLGIKAFPADCYLLLNSDTIVRPGAIRSLLSATHAHQNAGLVSPRLEICRDSISFG